MPSNAADSTLETSLRDVRDQKAKAAVLAFKRTRPNFLPTPGNYEAMVKTLAFNSALSLSEQARDLDEVADLLILRGYWSLENLQRCYDALSAQGLLDVPRGTPRNLSASERVRVSRLAQAGRIDKAIGLYLEAALPDEEVTLDPDYREVWDSAVWTVWEEITHDYTPTPAREAFLRRYCGERPITIPLLNAGWAELKKREAGYARSELLGREALAGTLG